MLKKKSESIEKNRKYIELRMKKKLKNVEKLIKQKEDDKKIELEERVQREEQANEMAKSKIFKVRQISEAERLRLKLKSSERCMLINKSISNYLLNYKNFKYGLEIK